VKKAILSSLLCALALSSTVWAQRPGCGDVKFSDELLGRFPRAPEACLDVISRDGEDYGVFKARLSRISGNTLHLRFEHPDGSQGPRTTIRTAPDFRVLVDGKATRVRDLAPNQQLTAYVHVTRPMVALAPASESDNVVAVPLIVVPDTQRVASAEPSGSPQMPDTASPVALVGVLGTASFAAALCLMGARRRRTPHQ
jgi:hypothetical protein